MFQIINVSNIITQQEIFYQIFFGTEEKYQSSKSIIVYASKHHDEEKEFLFELTVLI